MRGKATMLAFVVLGGASPEGPPSSDYQDRGRRGADLLRRLDTIYNLVETTPVDMADFTPRIRRHRERQERLEYSAEQARAALAQRRQVHDDVNTIVAYAKDMRDFLKESESTEHRAFIESLVKEIVVMPEARPSSMPSQKRISSSRWFSVRDNAVPVAPARSDPRCTSNCYMDGRLALTYSVPFPMFPLRWEPPDPGRKRLLRILRLLRWFHSRRAVRRMSLRWCRVPRHSRKPPNRRLRRSGAGHTRGPVRC